MSKKELGQYYTTNVYEIFDKVFKDFKQYYNNESIYEPCCGNGDIIDFLISNDILNISAYDITNDTHKLTVLRDTINEPLDFNNSWIITNPPFLAKNKMTKEIKEKYKDLRYCDDLYELYILQLLKSNCLGGILILPSNFLFSYSNKIRKQFIKKYEIKTLKIYEKQIFNDTTSSVIVFNFIKRKTDNYEINTILIQKEKTENFNITLSEYNDYTYGSELYTEKFQSNIKIYRYVNDELGEYKKTNIEIFTLDPKIKAIYNENPQINKISDRSKINIIINRKLKDNEQHYIINSFNNKIKKYRDKYHSLFMSSYREFSRKRLDFNLIYIILKNIINKMFYILKYSTDVNEKTIIKLCKISYLKTFTDIYNFVLDKTNRININHFKQFYTNKEYEKKYLNYYKKFSHFQDIFKSYEEFKNYIYDNLDNPFIQSVFIKNNTKQTIHEIIQVYIMEDRLKMKFERNRKYKLSKTKTFDYVNHENKILLCCKFIGESGGSQDNQLIDLSKFNDYSYETDYKILLVVSGEYGISKMNDIKLNGNVELVILR